ncbi:MAG: lysophospholipid acyltransferase family protein [Polyangiales bacterium]
MLDGFEPHDADALVGFRPDACERFARRIERLGRLLHVEVDGLHRLPAGRALLVANHAFGWDVAFAMAAIRTRIGRPIFALGEHLWWKVPYLRRLAASVGTVDGTPDNIDRLLDAEQLVLVLPGGLREAVKPSTLRYRLLWGERYGFVRAAIKNRAPMVPLASIGADEVFELTGDAYARGRKIGLSLPLPRFSSLPHRVHLRYVIGEPVAPIDPPSSCDDPSVLKRARWTIEGALQELIDRELGSRSH